MLPRKERLSRQEFNRFFSLGRRIHSPSFQLVYTQYPELHVSVVVSKKVATQAVSRNKIRRRIYDIVRRYRIESGMSGVFIFLMKPESNKKTYEQLKEEVRQTLSRQ